MNLCFFFIPLIVCKIGIVVLLQYSIIFIDSEGSPTQELSALEMDHKTREIVDVFHGHAFTVEPDFFARRHIHGLNPEFLREEGYKSPTELIEAFHSWIRGKRYIFLYGNNPSKEVMELQLFVSDLSLDPWKMRSHKAYHEVAYSFKRHNIPICSKSCSKEAHSEYRSAYVRPFNLSDAAKERHGHHCSLYDCFELYLFYISIP